jgi:hypothetical protein
VGDALEGRDLTYLLPPTSVHVLSLLPGDAIDIRDPASESFGDIDARLSRASVFRVTGGILMGFAGLAIVVAISRLAGSTRQGPAVRPLASDAAILREVGRELADLRRSRDEGAWTPTLTARLLTSLRILAGYALGVPAAAQRAAAAHPVVPPLGGAAHGASPPAERAVHRDGSLMVRPRWLGRSEAAVAGWVTPAAITQELKRWPDGSHPRAAVLSPLETALSRLTRAQYGRDTSPDEATIDEALTAGVDALRQVKIDNLWIVKRVRDVRARTGLGGRL